MDIKFKYYSDVKDGKLQKNIAKRISEELKHYEGKRIELTIERLRSKRSTQQNRLYWLYVSIIANELGYNKQEMHDLIKYKFLKHEKVFEKTGEVFEYLKSSSELSKSEFADMVTDLIRWCAETFSISLPAPNEQMSAEFNSD